MPPLFSYLESLSVSKRYSRAYSLLSIVCLALGVGAAAAMVSTVDVLLRSQPPGTAIQRDLVRLYLRSQVLGGLRLPPGLWATKDYGTMEADSAAFSIVAAAGTAPGTWAFRGRIEGITAGYASAEFFAVIGARASKGRLFNASDTAAREMPVVVVSADWWRNHDTGAASPLGATVAINGVPAMIVGVTEPDFRGLEREPVDVWIPLRDAAVFRGTDPAADTAHVWLRVLATLRPGVPAARAMESATLALARAHGAESAQEFRERVFVGSPTTPYLLIEDSAADEDTSRAEAVHALVGVSVLVLVLALIAVGNLALIEAIRGARDAAIRMALGARGHHTMRLLVGQGMVLFVGTAVGALTCVRWSGGLLNLVAGVPPNLSLMNARSIALVVLLALLATVLVESVRSTSYWWHARPEMLREGHGTALGQTRLLRLLLSGQVAVAIVLVVAAGEFLSTYRAVESRAPDWDLDHLLVADLAPLSSNTSADARAALAQIVRARMAREPGVVTTSQGLVMPFRSSSSYSVFADRAHASDGISAMMNAVDSGYARVVGFRLVRGRTFDIGDFAGSHVGLVNETLARDLWGRSDPIGRCLYVAANTVTCVQVVGVVRDSRYMSLVESPEPFFLVPLTSRMAGSPLAVIYARTATDATPIAARLARALPTLSPSATHVTVTSYRLLLGEQLAAYVLRAKVSAAFGLIALLVAVISAYALSLYLVEIRSRELAVRAALGANAWHITREAIGVAVRQSVLGGAVGIFGAFVVNDLLRDAMFGLAGRVEAIVAIATSLVVAAGVVGAIPAAIRATRVDPMAALRAD